MYVVARHIFLLLGPAYLYISFREPECCRCLNRDRCLKVFWVEGLADLGTLTRLTRHHIPPVDLLGYLHQSADELILQLVGLLVFREKVLPVGHDHWQLA